MTTDTSERGLERLICTALTGAPCDPGAPADELFRQFMDNESFRRWMTDMVFGLTYERPGRAG